MTLGKGLVKGLTTKHRSAEKGSRTSVSGGGDAQTDKRDLYARISAACKREGTNYSKFIGGLRKAGENVDKRKLADLSVSDPASFRLIVKKSQDALKIAHKGRNQSSSAPHNLVIAVGGGGKRKYWRVHQSAAQSLAAEEDSASRLVAAVELESPDVNALCTIYGLRREELGRLTGFSVRALADWSAGKIPSQPAVRRLHEIRRLLDALAELVSPDAIPGWLRKPNPSFDNLPPLQVIEVGEIDRLWAMVHERLAAE